MLFDAIDTITEFKPIRVPYMGSKQLICRKLILEMIKHKPNAKYFVDLFGGGGSMSFMASQMGFSVVYNELQTSLVEFIKYIFERIKNNEKSKFGIFPEEFYNFVDRDTFYKVKNDNTIFAQFCRICYSFGNNQRSYAFTKEGNLELNKKLGHNIVMFQCENSLKEFNELNNTRFTISNKKAWNERRLDFKIEWNMQIKECEFLKNAISDGFCKNLRDLRTGQKKEKYIELKQSDRGLQRLEQLEQLEQLERLQQLEQQRICFFNLDYKNVIINTPIEETIVYIDGPYRNTSKYIEGKDFNYLELDDWFRNNKYTCFMSEYDAPHKCIFETTKSSHLLNKRDCHKKVIEKLYINK